MQNKKQCVYTALIGNYEELNEQPVSNKSNIDFLCFTDNKSLESETWKIVHVEPIFPYDPARSAKAIKIAPHRYLPKHYETSLYIDNSVKLKVEPEIIFHDLLSEEYNLYCVSHSFRDSVLDEFEEVLRLSYENSNIIIEQLNAYSLIDPDLFSQKPYWAGFMIRNHSIKSISNMMEDWLAQVMRYSRRDQLSLIYAIRKYDIKTKEIHIDNHTSIYHEWPAGIRYGSPSMKQSLFNRVDHNLRVKVLENKLKKVFSERDALEKTIDEQEKKIDEQEKKIEKISDDLGKCKQEVLFYATSKSWRITRPLRKIVKQFKRK